MFTGSIPPHNKKKESEEKSSLGVAPSMTIKYKVFYASDI